ncbi:MAG: phosphoribulokinase [Nitrosomonadaceae bacterium]|nr:phosphoribulokinase [Nitrosomonadaceae bacterium]|tara:strand:+ start:1470 stop:2342 length:873 start_codon:yes stop_codon:yes gene_type:complete
MSKKHPVIAVTGSSGAGTSTVKNSFEQIFHREKINVAVVEGDSFHRYDRAAMKKAVAQSERDHGHPISHFGPEANEFKKLETLFKEYGKNGKGKTRLYLHNEEEAAPYKQKAGTFTPWSPIAKGSDMLFYEGLHGGVKSSNANVAKYVDLLVGVVPAVNLEWIQKIYRDTNARGYSVEAVTDTILLRMHDYAHYITPQFSRTHINFQRVPTVDTSDPFIKREIPSLDESIVVIRFQDYKRVDFSYLLSMIHDSFMSRPNTLVVPGGKMGLAIELILTPLILDMVVKKKKK